MENLFDKIEPYIDGQLDGEELKNFEETLQKNPKLQKEVAVYQTIVAGIQAKETDRLRKKFAALDVGLNKQLEEEEQQRKKEVKHRILSMTFRKSFALKAAATILVTFTAYTLFTLFTTSTKNETPAFAWDKYEVEYSGWVEQNTPKETEKTESVAAQDDISDSNTQIERTNNGTNTPLSSPNQEGVILNTDNTPRTPSISTPQGDDPISLQYQDADYHFDKGNYTAALNRLQQIADYNTARKYFRMGMTYYYRQDLKDALTNLSQALEKKGEDALSPADLATAKWYLAMTYARQGDMKNAKSYFNELAKGSSIYSKNAKEVISVMR